MTLPAYTLRISPRARQVRLRVDARGLTLVVPRGFDPSRAPAILARHGPWIEKTLRRWANHETRLDPTSAEPPRTLELRAVDRVVQVDYVARAASGAAVLTNGPDRLLVRGFTENLPAVRHALVGWLRQTARQELGPWLSRVAEQTGLTYAGLTVRLQRSRWGSCSRAGRISLNAGLLFVPPALVQSVLVHELCHTRQMDHSSSFWSLVLRHDPDAMMHRRMLRGAMRLIPSLLVTEQT